MNLNSIAEILKNHQPELRKRGVKSLAVFGSVARGDADENSDLDLLVEFSNPVGLFEFIRLKYYLEELTHQKVDLVTSDALRPIMRDSILSEAVHVA
jgi:predicted nucleotidyltransferase